MPGQLGDPRAFALFTASVHGRNPGTLRQIEDRVPRRRVDAVAEGELDLAVVAWAINRRKAVERLAPASSASPSRAFTSAIASLTVNLSIR